MIRSTGYWAFVWSRLLANRPGAVCGGLLLLLGAVAIAGPGVARMISGADPNVQDLSATFLGPGTAGHPLGTDELGRDTLSRLLWGARVSLLVSGLSAALAVGGGATVGVVAGYFGRWLDGVLMRAVDVILSVPSVYLLILLATLTPRLGPVTLSPREPLVLALIVAVVAWPGPARLVRAEVLLIKSRDFVAAARSLGAGDARVMLRHVLPHAAPVLLVAATLQLATVIVIEAALDFVGLGIGAPTASWGNLLANSQVYFYHSPWLVLLPGATIATTVLATTVFGNALRDALDPRLAV
jgi:peptide/nickel transport system permease protein